MLHLNRKYLDFLMMLLYSLVMVQVQLVERTSQQVIVALLEIKRKTIMLYKKWIKKLLFN